MKLLIIVTSLVALAISEEAVGERGSKVKRGVIGYGGYAGGYGYGHGYGHYDPIVSYVEPVISKASYGYKPHYYGGHYGGHGHGYGYGHGILPGFYDPWYGYYGHGYGYGHGYYNDWWW